MLAPRTAFHGRYIEAALAIHKRFFAARTALECCIKSARIAQRPELGGDDRLFQGCARTLYALTH